MTSLIRPTTDAGIVTSVPNDLKRVLPTRRNSEQELR